MNYDRFAKPYNFGEYDTNNFQFVLDKPIEEGIYLVTLIDHLGEWFSNGILTIRKDTSIEGIVYVRSDEQNNLTPLTIGFNGLYLKDIDGNEYDVPSFANGTIVELYKIA